MTDRELLQHIRAEIDAHLAGEPEPPVTPPGEWGTNGPPPADVPEFMYPTWRALGNDPAHPRGGYTCQESVAHLRAHNGYTGTGCGGAPPVVPPPVTPPPAGPLPPAPGPDSQSWTGNTMPLRIIEKAGRAHAPVAVTIVAGGESRTFHRADIAEGRTIQVPRGVDIQVIAHFEPSASAGIGGWGFTALKIKGMRSSWGFSPAQVHSGNQSAWEPYTTNSVPGAPLTPWGGALQTICGGVGLPPGQLPTFWTYTIPAFLTVGSAAWPVDFFVVWLMDHQYPRAGC